MSIVLQDPGLKASHNLLCELRQHLKDADVIRCAFAFATAKGISLLFDDPDVRSNLAKADTELIVGMDAITDARAIKRLSILCEEFKKISAKAFLPPDSGIFHPKISWVKKGNEGAAITGSGNLTTGGLGNNFEAFSTVHLDTKSIIDVETNWLDFIQRNKANLFSLDSDEVKNAAEQNGKIRKAVRRVKRKIGKKETSNPPPDKEQVIFIEELTNGRPNKHGDRMQRDIGTWASDNYFEKGEYVSLTYVDSSGKRIADKPRKITKKSSKNYAIDLLQIDGMAKVDDQLPIAIFVKIAPKEYWYHILPVNSIDYEIVYKHLEKEVPNPGKGNARRPKKLLTPAELLEIWPSAPFWD